MSSWSSNLTLRELFARALQTATKASKLSMIDNATQDLVVSSLHDLKMLAQGIDASGMFSSNESLEDIPTRHLPYLLVEFVTAAMEGRVRALDRAERMEMLRHSQRHLRIFLDRLHRYKVIPEEQRKSYSKKFPEITDLAKRREIKIKQFKLEKELRSNLEIIRRRRWRSVASTGSDDDLDLIAFLLPLPNASDEGQQADDDNDDEEFRNICLLAIHLMWLQGQSQLQSMDQELELLLDAPPVEPESWPLGDERDATWRLDSSMPRGGPDGKGPLMDSSGKPLRPFTILPGSTSSERSRLQSAVFQPDHRLPTMTMDEYLEEEKRRGNIITGGGTQSQFAPTRSEQLTLDSEMEGTIDGELKAEQKRQEDESWARYTDLHPKGEGNTMNRG